MCDIVSYRGPDDAGYVLFSLTDQVKRGRNIWFELTDNDFKHKNVHLAPIESDYARSEIESNQWHLALGHRRLAIIDLSPKAHQPMSDRGKGVWITYSGEVYNFKDLRSELERVGHTFYSESDTEVIIHSYQEWGIDCVNRFNGMFTFALWDNDTNKLFLVRDRYGIKPLYYYFKNGILLFGSEIKSILESGYVKADIDYAALNEYFTFQNIFSDLTLFRDIKILPAGSFAQVDCSSRESSSLQLHRFWDYDFSQGRFDLSEAETEEELHRLFVQAVNRQLVSDVPVGSYLSGGMDTGSIASVAGKHFGRICTFTVGFDLTSASGLELGCDERAASEILANLLKTEHYEVVLHAGDMEQVIPELIWHLEDLRVGQCYPNYYAARLAGKFVKVVLSGGGGDELFGGYPWRYYRTMGSLDQNDYYRRYYEYWQRLTSEEEKPQLFNRDTFHQLNQYSTFDVFRDVLSQANITPSRPEDYVAQSMRFEAKTFLHGLFVVEDKLCMAHSLETRVPFLDNDLVDFAQRIPVGYKLRNLAEVPSIDEDELGKKEKYFLQTNDGKNILRNAMSRIIPHEITERKKQGFSAPDASWFRGESIEYIKTTLLDPKAKIYEFVNPNFVGAKIDEHVSGKINHRLLIWSLLSFEWWCRNFLFPSHEDV